MSNGARRDWLVPWLLPVAAGLTAFGHGPWWMVLAWSVGFWAARSSETARKAALTMPLVLALIGSLSAWPDLLAFTALYLRLLAVGLALHFALDLLEERLRRGLLLFALVLITAPTAPGILGFILAGITLGHLTQRGARRVTSPRAYQALAVAALAMSALAWMLPSPPPLALPAAEVGAGGHVEDQAGVPEERATATTGGSPWGARRPATAGAGTQPNSMWAALGDVPVLVALGLMTLALVLLGWRAWQIRVRARRGERWHWSDVQLVLGLATVAVMLALYGLLNTSGSASLGAEGSPPSTQEWTGSPSEDLAESNPLAAGIRTALVGLGLLAMVVLIPALIGLIVFLLRQRPGNEEKYGNEQGSDLLSGVTTAPLNRVRAAYKAMLAALGTSGLPRAQHETPRELALRAGRHFPELSVYVVRLTELYEPVRYGRTVTEEHAEQAEAALARITDLLPDQPGPSSQAARPQPE